MGVANQALVQNEVADAIGVAQRIQDGDGGPLGEPRQHDAIRITSCDTNRFYVVDLLGDGGYGCRAIGETATSLIEAEHPARNA